MRGIYVGQCYGPYIRKTWVISSWPGKPMHLQGQKPTIQVITYKRCCYLKPVAKDRVSLPVDKFAGQPRECDAEIAFTRTRPGMLSKVWREVQRQRQKPMDHHAIQSRPDGKGRSLTAPYQRGKSGSNDGPWVSVILVGQSAAPLAECLAVCVRGQPLQACTLQAWSCLGRDLEVL